MPGRRGVNPGCFWVLTGEMEQADCPPRPAHGEGTEGTREGQCSITPHSISITCRQVSEGSFIPEASEAGHNGSVVICVCLLGSFTSPEAENSDISGHPLFGVFLNPNL